MLARNGRLGTKEPEKDGLKFRMMLAFGQPKGTQLRESTEFKRRSLEAISDQRDERLESARLAPSSVNSQPWYFTHEDDVIHVYCALSGVIRKKQPSAMNRIDIGIALAHLYLTNPNTFRFFKAEHPAQLKNYAYIGSFTL